MRYYLSSCEYKWSHKDTDLEHLWVRRELGEDLFKECNQQGFNLVYLRSSSQTMPSDIYLRCDIYVDVEDTKDGTLFALKHSEAICIPDK